MRQTSNLSDVSCQGCCNDAMTSILVLGELIKMGFPVPSILDLGQTENANG